MRRHRRPLAFALFAVLSGALAYGCGGSDGVSEDGDSGSLPGEEGGFDATLGSDGVVPGDGSKGDGAGDAPRSETSTDAADTSDADANDGAVIVDAGEDADSGIVDPPPPPPPPQGPLSLDYVDHLYNHILSTGQSNAVASGARPFTTLPYVPAVTITNTQPFTNVMFQTGVMTSVPCNTAGNNGCTLGSYVTPTAFVPLVEGDTFFGGSYVVETASSAMANLISQIATTTYMFGHPDRPARYPAKHDVLVSLHGRSGNKYVCLRKTAQTDPNRAVPSDCKLTLRPAFAEGMMQAQAAYDLAGGDGKHVVRAVTVIHGESDHNGMLGDFPMTSSGGTPNAIKNYADALIEWQQDYEAGVKAITNQAEPVPLLVMGLSGWTGPGEPGSTRYSLVAAQQHDAHVRAPGKVVLVGPGYFVDQGTKGGGDPTPECLHQSIVGERQIGEYFAKVYAQVVFKGQPWEPVRPKLVTRAGAVVTVEYHVPVPPLTLDTTLVTAPSGAGGDPPAENNGFEYRINGRKGTRIAINSVVVSGPTTVTITLAQDPGGADHHLLYAQNQRPAGFGCTGPGVQSNGSLYAGGARGNLRDSDPTVSRYGFPLYNWGVIFDVPVP